MTDPNRATILVVRERDGWACVRCGAERYLTTQHRVSRGMGGSAHRPWVNRPANLITLCGSGTTGCHGWVEHHPHEARAFGWALTRYGATDPEDCPVLWWDGCWYRLDNDGGRHAIGRHPGGSGGGWGIPVDRAHVGAEVPGGAAQAGPLPAPFPV